LYQSISLKLLLFMQNFEQKMFQFFLGEKTKQKIEKSILYISIVSFLIHLILIYLVKFEIVRFEDGYGLFTNPITAIYTPFSFILLYEIYLLVYYLPRSITTYISKQYEIITLIIIRRIFKDISNLNLSESLFTNEVNVKIFIDLGASLVLFLLIYLFRKNTLLPKTNSTGDNIEKFIRIKRWMSSLLIPTLILLGLFNFIPWVSSLYDANFGYLPMSSVNNIFFDEFFQLLIIVDVMLLIFSFFNSDLFHKIMRNSGFIISTILIRVSFLTEGLTNVILIISSLIFGLLILLIYNECEKNELFKP
jgi:hypothetical protein